MASKTSDSRLIWCRTMGVDHERDHEQIMTSDHCSQYHGHAATIIILPADHDNAATHTQHTPHNTQTLATVGTKEFRLPAVVNEVEGELDVPCERQNEVKQHAHRHVVRVKNQAASEQTRARRVCNRCNALERNSRAVWSVANRPSVRADAGAAVAGWC